MKYLKIASIVLLLFSVLCAVVKKGSFLEETMESCKFAKKFPQWGHIKYRFNEQNFHQQNIEFLWQKLQKTAHDSLKK